MELDFRCKNFKTIMKSLSTYFDCNNTDIYSFLEKEWVQEYELFLEKIILEYRDYEYCDFSEYLYKNAISKFKPSEKILRIHWFHGTRVINPVTIKNDGIRPLQEMTSQLSVLIDDIAKGIEFKDTPSDLKIRDHAKFIIDIKLGSQVDLGPCSMLMYDALIHPDMYNFYNYNDIPEFVRDYANWKYGNQSETVFEKFKKIAKPVIVEFVEPTDSPRPSSKSHVVGTALNFVYSLLHNGYNKDSFGISQNTCYSNYGKRILPKQIVQIYEMPFDTDYYNKVGLFIKAEQPYCDDLTGK